MRNFREGKEKKTVHTKIGSWISFLFSEDREQCPEKTKYPITRSIEQMKKFSNVTPCVIKFKTLELIIYLQEISEKEFMKPILCICAVIKHLGIYLFKNVHGLYSEYYNVLMK